MTERRPARSILLVSYFYPPAREVASQRPDALARHLRRLGYEVTFREFDGGHEMPADVARDGMRWAAATPL